MLGATVSGKGHAAALLRRKRPFLNTQWKLDRRVDRTVAVSAPLGCLEKSVRNGMIVIPSLNAVSLSGLDTLSFIGNNGGLGGGRHLIAC